MSALEVLWCDNHVLAIQKPAGLPSVPDESGDESALDLARAWVKQEYNKPGDVFLGVVHRLDRPVSGVLCFGRTSKGAARLTEALRERRVQKTYLGVVQGELTGEGFLEQSLLKDSSRNRVNVVGEGTEGARLARTRWRVLRSGVQASLLELEPLTGRSHQLRVACATLGAPLLGDLKYGAQMALPDRSVALHSLRYLTPHPSREEQLRIECRPPRTAWWRIATEVKVLSGGGLVELEP